MASRKGSSGGSKKGTAKATRSRGTKKAAQPRTPRAAVPPPDDPLRRHEEADADRLLLTYTPAGGVTAAAAPGEALAQAMRPRRGAAAAAAPVRTVRTTLAALRVAAVRDTRSQPPVDAGAPLAPAPMAAALGGAPFTVAPLTGVSNWVQLGPVAIPKGQTYGGSRVLVTGRITSIDIDRTNPNTLYAGAAQGGVWKSVNGGKNWTPTSDNELSIAIGAIAVDPVNPQTVYAGTGEGNFSGDSYYGNGVMKSVNGGATWTTNATTTFMGARFCRIAITPGTTTRLFGATTIGLYRSNDGGVNWTKMTGGGLPGLNCTDVCIDRTNPNTVYAAFWGQGIWRTTNANAGVPSWTQLTSGLPGSGFARISLGISRSSPNIVYALISASNHPVYTIDGFYRTTDSGNTWTAIPLPGGSIGKAGFYNLNIAVDAFTPDVVYLGAVSLFKAVRSPAGAWTVTDIGLTIHPDNHSFAQHPTNPAILYAGNDGGIYRSLDGGATWDDSINKDLCITQFEFISQHPTSDAVVLGGTQDNGTEQFRTDPVFYHSDDGDGGYTCIEQAPNPLNALSTYFGATPKRSTQGAKFGTWFSVQSGINPTGSLFYPPMAMDGTNSQNVALGTASLNLTTTQGTAGWTSIAIPGFGGSLSAIDFVNSSLIYAGASNGSVFCFRKSGTTWNVTAIGAAPLPSGAHVTDIAAVPGSPANVIVTFSGFNIPHVWRGVVPATGPAAWTDISGSGPTGLPNIPINALVIDPVLPNTLYVASDVAVHRSTTGGTTWTMFSHGLPNCAVFDLRLHNPTRLLRAATHGRGLWEKQLDVTSLPPADLYFRDHAMATGRVVPTPNNIPAAYEDPLQKVVLGAPQWYWMTTDIKVDSLAGTTPQYQFPVADVDYVVYEAKLQHRNPIRGQVSRAYVQVHNRGFAPAANVTVKLFWADASAGLPPLPADFWTMFPGNSSDTTKWHPIGAAKVIPSLSQTLPSILEWDFTLPLTAANHTCLLVIMDSPSDPIPAASKILNVDTLINIEKRAALKNLVVVGPAMAAGWFTVDFNAVSAATSSIRILGTGTTKFAVALPQARVAGKRRSVRSAGSSAKTEGLRSAKATQRQAEKLKQSLGDQAASYDTNAILFSQGRSALISGLKLPKGGLRAAFSVVDVPSQPETITIVQEEDGKVVGGFTIVVSNEQEG